MTLLHLACVRSEVEVIRLLDAGAKSNIVTAEGRNVLHIACRARNSNVLELLLNRENAKVLIILLLLLTTKRPKAW